MKSVWVITVCGLLVVKICATKKRAKECVTQLVQDHLGTTRDEYVIGEYELD